jgi:hypothetical protein
MPARKKKKFRSTGLPEDTKFILVIITLIFAYPIGLFLMFFWTKWPVWLKLLVCTPLIIIFFLLLNLLGAKISG